MGPRVATRTCRWLRERAAIPLAVPASHGCSQVTPVRTWQEGRKAPTSQEPHAAAAAGLSHTVTPPAPPPSGGLGSDWLN